MTSRTIQKPISSDHDRMGDRACPVCGDTDPEVPCHCQREVVPRVPSQRSVAVPVIVVHAEWPQDYCLDRFIVAPLQSGEPAIECAKRLASGKPHQYFIVPVGAVWMDGAPSTASPCLTGAPIWIPGEAPQTQELPSLENAKSCAEQQVACDGELPEVRELVPGEDIE